MEFRQTSVYSPLAALGSFVAASSCCLPLGTFWLAAGAAGVSPFLDAARPYLIGLSVVLVAFGFWQAREAGKCDRRPGVWNAVLLWSAAIFLAFSILFPQALAGLVAGRAGTAPEGQRPMANFDLASFEQSFDQAPGPKLVLLLSPT